VYAHLSPEEVLAAAYTQPTLTALELALCQQLELVLNAYEVVCETVFETTKEVEAGEIAPLIGIASIKSLVEPDEVETVYVQ
jgi:hypothetical protein